MIVDLFFIRSVVGKPLCYHGSNPGLIRHGGYTIRSPNLRTNLAFHPSEVRKRILDNFEAINLDHR